MISLISDSPPGVEMTKDLLIRNVPDAVDEWIENDSARGLTYYIIESDRMAVGCVALEKANSDHCYLERLGVLPEARRKGFGRKLIDHVIFQANNFGAKKIGIGIIADDTELKRWYQRIGFVQGDTKEFRHLPFLVMFMTYEL